MSNTSNDFFLSPDNIKFRAIFFNKTICLVPNELAQSQLQRQLFKEAEGRDEGACEVAFSPKILTFAALENQLTAELATPEIAALIDPLERKLILTKLAEPLANDLAELAGFPDNFGRLADKSSSARGEWLRHLADQLGDGFDRFKLAGLTWEQVAGLKPELLAGLLSELGGKYDGILRQRGKTDRFSRRRQMLEGLRYGRHFETLAGVEQIFCQGLQRLSPFETDFITALANGRQVKLTMTVPPWVLGENIEHGSGFDLLQTIKAIEKSPEDGLFLELFTNMDGSGPQALAYASDTLLAPLSYRVGEPPDPSGQITRVQASTAYHEAEEVGRRLKEALQSGLAPEELAVVVPDMGSYGPLFDDVGRRFELAFHFRRGLTRLVDEGPVRAVLAMMELWTSNWERSRLMEIIRNPYFIFPKLQNFSVTELHNLTLKVGVSDQRAGGGLAENLNKFISSLNGRASEVAQALIEQVEYLKEAKANLDQAESWADFFYQFKTFLDTVGWPGCLDLAPSSPLNARGADLAAAWAFKEELEHLEEAFKAGPAPELRGGVGNFKLWLTPLLEERYLNYDTNSSGRIRVLNHYDLQGGSFEEIFFVGLNARVFPKTGPEVNWWPQELIRSAALMLGRPLWNDATARYRQEELLLAAGLGQARRRVWLFYHQGDEAGKMTLASPLLAALAELWPDGESSESTLPLEVLQWSPVQPLAKVAGVDELWASIVKLGFENCPSQILKNSNFKDIYGELTHRHQVWHKLHNGVDIYSDDLGLWQSNLAQYQGKPLLRASFLATMDKCPYGFWWQEILGLCPDGSAIEEWPRTDEGTVIHRVLELFFKEQLNEKAGKTLLWPGGITSKEIKPKLLKILEAEIKNVTKSHPLGRKPLWEIRQKKLVGVLCAWLERELAAEASVEIKQVEWSFGARPKDNAPPWELALSQDNSIYFQGRIDRLDRLGAEQNPELGRILAVHDYKLKLSSTSFKMDEDGASPNSWSILVYALAAQNALGREDEVVGTIFEGIDQQSEKYFVQGLNTTSPSMEVGLRKRVAMGKVGAYNFPQTLADTWENIKSGKFSPGEIDTQECSRCSFNFMCPTTEKRSGRAENE